MTTYRIQLRDGFILILILFCAGILRWGEPAIVDYFHDDGMLATLAQEMAQGTHWHWTGIISSVGIPNSPWTIYLLLPAFLLSSDPIFAIVYIMSLNVVGVGLLWWIAHRYFGRLTGLMAGLAYALSPWAVLYSRKLWAQDYHTPFILLALMCALYGLEGERNRRRGWAQALSLPLFLIGVQVHVAAWFLMPAFAWLWVWRRTHVQWPALIAGLMLAFASLLPYLIGLSQTLADDPTRISDALARSEASAGLRFTGQPVESLLYLLTGYGMETWLTPDQTETLLAQVPPIGLGWLLPALALLGLAWLVIMRPWRGWAVMLIAWGLLPFLAFVPAWTQVYTHYFIPLIPALCLLIGLGMVRIVRILPGERLPRIVLLSAFGLILLTQVMWWRGALRYLDAIHIPYPGFTTPLTHLLPIREALSAYDDVVVLSYGMAWNQHHESVVWPTLLHQRTTCIRTLIGEGYAVLPAGPFAVLTAPDAPPNPVNGLYAGPEARTFPERTGGGVYTLTTFDNAPAWNGVTIQTVTPAIWQEGIELTGYGWNGETIALKWGLPDGQRGQDYQASIKLYDSDDQLLAQSDRVFWHGRHWCAGDQLITWLTFRDISRADGLGVTLYELRPGDPPRFRNLQIIDEAGNPSGEQARFTLTPTNP